MGSMHKKIDSESPISFWTRTSTQFIVNRLSSFYPKNLGSEKFEKAFNTEQNCELIESFYHDKDKRCLVIPENLKVLDLVPTKLPKSKCVMLVKTVDVITEEDFREDHLIVIELSGATAFEHFEIISNYILLPVLTNKLNHQRWGSVNAHELGEGVHSFLSATSILCGQVKGDTRLPMPFIRDNILDHRTVPLLESAITTWTRQIKSVLAQDPEKMLKYGLKATPEQEIQFWKSKANSLNVIFQQLTDNTAKHILQSLYESKSTYYDAFYQLCQDLMLARAEANDNVRYLNILEPFFKELCNNDDMLSVRDIFRPMIHSISLIWKKSKYYNTPYRLAVLIKEVCNSLIQKASKFLPGEQIFQMVDQDEAAEALKQLRTIVAVSSCFKSVFLEYKAESFESCPLNPWRVQVNTIFSELDSFLDRCDDTIDFVQTVIHFSKLPRIEIGSTKGRTLTDAVHAIYADLNAAILHIKSQAHNVMDAEMKEIDHDFSTFQATVREVERKLASAISTGLDDCNSVYGRFQLLDSFDVDLLNRSTMRDEMEGRYISLFKEYVDDLQVVREIFLGFKDNPPQDTTRYLPPFAAKLTWCRSLLARIQLPMQKFQQLDNEILDREEAKEAQKVQTYLISSLQTYETNSVNEWSVSVEQVSVQKLCLPLLERNTSTRHIMTNFDPALVWMLREVKYLTQLQVSVPPAALEVFQSCETFRRWVGNLDIIVNLYNFVLNELLPVEKPLIAPYLMKVDKCIRVGVEDMNWKSVGIDTFITNALDNVRSMHDILMIMKNNLSSIEELCRSWNTALIDRRVKPEDKGEFERSAKALRNMRFSSIKESGKQIHNLLKETNRILRVSNSAPDWRYYVDFVSNIVIDGLSSAVVMSLAFLLQQVSPSLIQSTGRLPLLDVKLDFDLETMSLKFDPDLDHHSGEGIADMFDNIIGSFIQVGSLFKRLDTDGTYTREILSNITINGYLSKLSDAFFENKQLFSVFKQAFEEYSNLWSSEFPSQFSSFLANATKVTSYGIVALDIGLFDRAINYLKDIQDSISKVKSSSDIGFLRIDVTPAKHQISLLVMKSINKYTKFMLENVLTSLSDLNLFMDNAGKTLALTNIEGGCRGKSLMDIMAIIRDVRKKMETFEDNRRLQLDCVQALRRYGVDLNNAVISGQCLNDFLEELPLRWEALIKKTFKTKEDILPFQIESINSLKIDVENFYYSVRAFRGDFRANAPFKFSGTGSQAYQILGTYADALDNLELEVTRFNELEDLFELQESSFCEIGETRSEIKILKHLWDFKAMVDLIYAGWRTMLWKDVNVDTLDDQNKKLRKQLKDYGNSFPSMKGWQVYRDIDDLTTVFSISLPLINELHSDAIRPRHWSALARICNVKAIEPSQKTFSLSDMMNLNLHKFSESIEEIVETAAKEVKIERKLAEINHLWSSIELDYVFHKDSDLLLPNPSDDVVENMEAHQMELQGIFAMGKFMEFFRDDVVNWQSRLRLLDDTLRMWVQVARTWVSLEAIFLASVDIRSQLPEDTKRFDGIDSDFKELMKEATLEKNCLNSCTVNGRYAALKGMRDRLELCQKSLNEYLDIKKKIFPRFYFVSSSALLDMVANGRSPTKIVPYLGDCYDALAGLSFTKDSHGIQSDKIVETMIAKDGETVPLCAPFIMDGEVEHYLNRLTGVMQQSLKVILSDAMEKAASWEVDIPRQEWIFHYPAQLCITGTQIYWTDETQQALEEYEGGQEDAVKRYLQMCNYRLSSLIQLVLGKLSAADRTKIISLITMDVHSRDVVDRLISSKTEGPTAFTWQQQLRFEWDPPKMDVNVKICDFSCKYFYEWVGNTGRLVITPLTDRCYITLTMALKLFLGGAPAGPAGTGKTETTKDLARALAIPCYVFNCSDQMNFQSMADIFRGLTQTGAWGCFDEFNRIPIEVLSVVATQVKIIQDAILKFSRPENREEPFQMLPSGTPPVKVGYFEFMGDTIALIPTCGLFITMNPGYAGRTELPENLKALFRSCAMIRPDMKLIQENMLMAEGFQTARSLSVKFHTLYELSSALLSKQPHYDWGLRSVKSVLRVAGSMRRANPDLDEAQVLMRALRDFNTPKIPIHDLPIFVRIINDLFLGITVPSNVDSNLKERIIRVAKQQGLQCDESFVNKTCNFQELLDVRHSVMLLGPAGCAKTTIWKTLQAAHNLDKARKVCVAETVNPKAVTGDELYGRLSLSKDWKDGVLSIIMRGMSKNIPEQGFHDYQTHKWVVLDGDIDAVWIESMNTVMDDNKVLTLVSNERVPLSQSMRMVFEVNSLKNATPATVSRAGILFINESDIGWRPFVDSWIQRRKNVVEKNVLPSLFDRFIDTLVELTRKGYKEVTGLRLINKVSTVVYLLEGILPTISDENVNAEVIENVFTYCAMWAFGGPMIADKLVDYRMKFSEEFVSTFGLKFPNEGTCFDYFFEPELGEYLPWSSRISKYHPVPIGSNAGETAFDSIFVETTETARLTSLMNVLVRNGKYAMLVGNAGTGKSAMVKNFIETLDSGVDNIMARTIVMSYYYSSFTLQQEIEGYIDKRSGNMFGPPVGKKLLLFIDDMNLPYVETYGTQNSIALLTQHMQYGSVFDRNDLGIRKHLMDIQYVAAMNPTAGSFEICERCQRHFATFAVCMPSTLDLRCIFQSILCGHLSKFSPIIQDLGSKIVDAAIQIHQAVTARFLPSAVKFMYNWNMRELAQIFQGCCRAHCDYYIKPVTLVRLFAHEAERVYSDRLTSEDECEVFEELLHEVLKKNFSAHQNMTFDELISKPNIYTTFTTTTDGAYLPIPSFERLKLVLEAKLNEYNESNAMMDLVLFEQAILHVTRISRVIQNPGGNALLIGVGGSGKQSLCRLAAFICGYEVIQLQINSNFRVEDLKEVLRNIYKASGMKGNRVALIITDSQIVKEEFLVYINGILATGYIPGLFSKEDLDNILVSLNNDAKAENVPDNHESRLAYFISRVRKNLHVVLAFSPVGELFRTRARRFPGVINCTGIDQFHAWPKEALISVATRFIEEVDLGGNDFMKPSLASHMAEQHLSVAKMSEMYYETQHRYNYVTPKSFLELISFFKYLLGKKKNQLQILIDRLDVGISTLNKTSNEVLILQNDLKITLEKVEEKKLATENLINEMKMQQADAQVQDDAAKSEADKANIESDIAYSIEKQAERELAEAEPAMRAAAAAVDCLSKNMLSELKNLTKPPAGVDNVTNACLILIEKEYNAKKQTWNRAKSMMQNIDGFKTKLSEFKGENITDEEITLLRPFIEDPTFTPEKMLTKSAAAANLCTWVVNTYNYNRLYVKVKPLMDSLTAARTRKDTAMERLELARQKVAEVQSHLKYLEETYEKAMEEKRFVEDQAQTLMMRADLARRLVGGLASENSRWAHEIERLRKNASTLAGDCMLAAGFVSYVGAFDQQLRKDLWQSVWTNDLKEKNIPLTENSDPLSILTDDANNAKMVTDGLPSDRISIENGAILSNCKRWPLIIDPQGQGIKWLRRKEEGNLDVVQLSHKNWLKVVKAAILNGRCVIIENLGSDIDPTLDPILSRSVYKKGKGLYVRFGGEEIEYDPAFQLYLQTRLSNPHYKPEIAAQCTLINFIATEQGLEDQLLARVVEYERKDLEEKARSLTRAAIEYQMQLVKLEDDILERIANAPKDILSDVALIEGLEATKKTVIEINEAVDAGRKTQREVDLAREAYRPQASEGAMLYFLITSLNAIDHMYQYSLDSFIIFFEKSITRARKTDDLIERVEVLRNSLRSTIYTWISRGLFERHKLIFLALLTFNLMKKETIGDSWSWNEAHFQFLLRAPTKYTEKNPLPWLPDGAWASILALCEFDEFSKLAGDMIDASPRFREWFNATSPENEKLPLDWAGLDRLPFQKLLVIRCLRPDRMTVALANFVRRTLPNSSSFLDCDSTMNSIDILAQCLSDATPKVPIYFILSPGANIVSDLDIIAQKYGFQKGLSYHNISMGQGQDIVAMSCLEAAHRNGHWVLLNNVHLMPSWLLELEKKMDEFAVDGSHEKFRVFLTSDPSPSIPIGILSRCIKVTNEAPSGLKANLKRAWCSFSKDYIDDADSKTKSIVFGLCHFHSVIMERKMFGPMGFNMKYPFSMGDLRDSATCLQNYMDNSSGGKIPWQDLKYIFGEIMYGGHIVNDFDRLLANEYLNFYMKDELLDEMEMLPFVEEERGVSFMSPAPTTFEKYMEHIDRHLHQETPLAFGLHPNAEIDFRTQQSNALFKTLLDLRPREASSNEEVTPHQTAAIVVNDLLERFGDKLFDIDDLIRNLDEQGPYQNVFIQEMEVMNVVLNEIRRSLKELQLGFSGELTMSDSMENLMLSLYLDRIPSSWAKIAWPSLRPLASWVANFSDRLNQLDEWATNPIDIPKVTWLSGLVNPTSFLTAICQVTAQRNMWELDKLVTFTDVTKRMSVEEIESGSRDGAYIIGLSMQGARWDHSNLQVEPSRPKEMFCPMPIINIKAVTKEKANVGGIYTCPVYMTEQRGATWFFNAQLKTKSSPARWVLAGVALIADVSS